MEYESNFLSSLGIYKQKTENYSDTNLKVETLSVSAALLATLELDSIFAPSQLYIA